MSVRLGPCLSCLIVGLWQCASAAIQISIDDPPPAQDEYPAADLPIYEQALGVGDDSVVTSAIRAIGHYPDGADILLKFLNSAVGHRCSPTAVEVLLDPDRAASQAEGLQDRLVALWQRYDAALSHWGDLDNRSAERAREAIQECRGAIAITVALAEPDTYLSRAMPAIAGSLQAKRKAGLRDPIMQKLPQLLARDRRRHALVLLPALADRVETEFFKDNRETVIDAVNLLTDLGLTPQRDRDRRSDDRDRVKKWIYEHQAELKAAEQAIAAAAGSLH